MRGPYGISPRSWRRRLGFEGARRYFGCMEEAPKTPMTVDEFLAWAGEQDGSHELYHGQVYAMPPEGAAHAETKFAVQAALAEDIERLSIALPAPMANAVRRAVEEGEYASASEVIRDALRLWESRRQLRERDLDMLRRRWDEGKASGRAGPLDIPGLIAEERAKLNGGETGRG
jgi:antitoxin ParD1/3/4